MNWSSCCTFKILRTKKNSYKFLKIHNGKLYKYTVHLSICELEKYILGVSHLRHSITDIYYLALESYSLKFCYARHASFYSILYLILSTTELLYSKSLSNTTLHCKYSKSLSNTTSSNAVLDTTRFLKSSVLTLSNADFTVFCNISWATLMIPCTTLIFST